MFEHLGPPARSRQDRLAEAAHSAGALAAHYGAALIAVAVCGPSVTRDDGPFTPLEMFGLLREDSAPAGSAAVELMSIEAALRQVREVGPEWALRQGRFRHAVCVHGDAASVEELSNLAVSAPEADFDRACREIVQRRLPPLLADLRDARALRRYLAVPPRAVEFARQLALLLGLANRHCYPSAARMWIECRTLDRRPDGFDELLRMVTSGGLRDAEAVIGAAERAWLGVSASYAECLGAGHL